jgi:probable HAF family extracellular repeat protein
MIILGRETISRICRITAVAIAPLVLVFAVPASADPPPAAAGTTSHGFVAKGGRVTPIDHPNAATVPRSPESQTGTGTLGINDRGEILGVYEGRDRVIRHFVRNRMGRYSILDDPPGTRDDRLSYETADINNRGEIVGFYNDDEGATTTGFLRTRTGRFVDVNVPGARVTGPLKVNDLGQVVGIYADADGAVHGFVWKHGDSRTIDVPGAVATVALGINDSGQIVGSWVDADGKYHGFLRHRRGAVTTLPDAHGADPTSGGTQPASINGRGQIVGVAYDARGGSRGFLLDDGRYTPLDGARDAAYTRALDINDRGRIVGDYATRCTGGVRRALTSLRGDVRTPSTRGLAWLR